MDFSIEKNKNGKKKTFGFQVLSDFGIPSTESHNVLSRVYGSVTNKNGVLDWMIRFINTFFYNLS
jgi:hypothetical protein